MSKSGYIRLHRKLLENPIWTQLAPPVLKVTLYFLFKANWRKASWYDGRQQVSIPRGAFVTSYANAARDCRLTVKQTRLAFQHIERLGIASYERGSTWTMVAVRNYDEHQADVEDENGPKSGAQGSDQGDDKTGQGWGRDRGNKRGTVPAPVTPITGAVVGMAPADGAHLRAGSENRGGHEQGRVGAGIGATSKELKNLRTNTCASASPNARVGELPSIDDLFFENLPEPASLPKVETRRTKPRTGKELNPEQAAWFEEFWREYWLRKAKEDAKAAFAKEVTTAAIFETVIAGLRAQKEEMFRREASKRPYPATWINGRRWTDETESSDTVPKAAVKACFSDYPEIRPIQIDGAKP